MPVNSLIGLPAMARIKGPMNKVCHSVQMFSWKWLFSFFLELSKVLRAQMVLWQSWIFWKNIFAPKNQENRPSLGFFECIAKFN